MSDTGRIKALLERKEDITPTAFPVLVSIKSQSAAYSDLLRYCSKAISKPQYSANRLWYSDEATEFGSFDCFDFHSGKKESVRLKQLVSSSCIKMEDWIIDFSGKDCILFQLQKNGLKEVGKFKLEFDPTKIDPAMVCMSLDRQHVAFGTTDRETIVRVDLKNHKGTIIKPTCHDPFAALMFNEINELLVFFKPVKELPLRCVCYKPMEENIDISGLKLFYIQRALPLSGNRMVVIDLGDERDGSCPVWICNLKENTKEEIGTIEITAPLEIFNNGNTLVFQNYEENSHIKIKRRLTVWMDGKTFIYEHSYIDKLDRIIPMNPHVACLVFKDERGQCQDFQFLKLPRKLTKEDIQDATLSRLTQDTAGIVLGYADLWVSDDSVLPIFGGKAFNVSNIMMVGHPIMSNIMPYSILNFFKGTMDSNSAQRLNYLKGWREVDSISKLNSILSDLLLLLDEYLAIVKYGHPEPAAIQCRNDLELIVKSLNASSGSFLGVMDEMRNKYPVGQSGGRTFGVYLNIFREKAAVLPEIIERERFEKQFALDMAKETKFPTLHGIPAADKIILNNHLRYFFDGVKDSTIRPRILLERVINWVRVCEKLQKKADEDRPTGFFGFLTTLPPSAESDQLVKVLKKLEALREKGETVDFSEIYDAFNLLTSLPNYSSAIEKQIPDLARSLKERVDMPAKMVAKCNALIQPHLLAIAKIGKAEIKSSDEKKSTSPEAGLEALFAKIAEKQTTLHPEELFLPIYKWFEQGVAIAQSKYREAKDSHDDKALNPIDTFKRKIDTAYQAMTTYTTSTDKAAALKPIKDILEKLRDDPGCPELLNQHIKNVIALITPHIPTPADTPPTASPEKKH